MIVLNFYRSCLLTVIVTASPFSFAWGPDGHQTVGAIADNNLTPGAKAVVGKLLAHDLDAKGQPSGRTTLAEIASWPDELRSTPEGKKDASWHYRDNPLCESRQTACQNGHCIDAKINEMEAILKSPTASELEKNQALKWLVHLIGDIHQPLHTATNKDSGGNGIQVALEGVKTKGKQTLHKVWDTALVKELLKSTAIKASFPPNFVAGTPQQWLNESHSLALNVVNVKRNTPSAFV